MTKRIRYAVIGVKGIGQHHIRWAQNHPQVELVALVDVDEAFVVQKSAEFGVQAFTTHIDLIAAKVVEAVSIATPHQWLAPITRDCLDADLHVFVEKPLAIRFDEARALAALADQNQRQLAVAFQYRTYSTTRTIKRLLDQNAIGPVRRVLWTWFEFRSDAYYSRDAWRATWVGAGAGLLMNQISHDLDLLRYLFGEVRQVSAQLATHLHKTPLEDIGSIVLVFENGVQAVVQASINQPKTLNVRQIVGESGIISIEDAQTLTKDVGDVVRIGRFSPAIPPAARTFRDHHQQPKIKWRSIKTKQKRTLSRRILRRVPLVKRFFRPKPSSGHVPIFQSFIKAIQGDGVPLVSAADAAKTVELVNAILVAAVTQQTVNLPLDPVECQAVFDDLEAGRSTIPHL